MAEGHAEVDGRKLTYEARLTYVYFGFLMIQMVVRFMRDATVIYGASILLMIVLAALAYRNRQQHGWRMKRPEAWRILAAVVVVPASLAMGWFMLRDFRGGAPEPVGFLAAASTVFGASLLMFIAGIAVMNILMVLGAFSMNQRHFDLRCGVAEEAPAAPIPTPTQFGPQSGPGALARIADLGFVSALVLHLYSWTGGTPIPGWVVVPLFLFMFVVWIPTVLRLRKTPFQGGGFDGLGWFVKQVPRWMIAACVLSFVWAAINFQVSREEPTRLMTGHILPFYAIAMTALRVRP